MNGKIIYRYGQFAIRSVMDNKFIVINIKGGRENHSHVNSINVGKVICKLAHKKELPKSKDPYFIDSIIRITNNKKYIRELENLKIELEHTYN